MERYQTKNNVFIHLYWIGVGMRVFVIRHTTPLAHKHTLYVYVLGKKKINEAYDANGVCVCVCCEIEA